MAVRGATEQRQAEPLGELEPHLRDAAARDDDRHAHLRRLDHHLAGQAAGRVEDLVGAAHVVQPHPAGDRVDRVVAADVLDEGQHLALAEQRAAVHRAGRLVRALLLAHGVEQAVERRLRQARRRLRRRRQAHRIELAHQVAEHRALAAAGGDDALGGLLVEALDAGARLDGGGVDVPVDGDRIDLVAPIDEALVAQVAEDEQLGEGAERHQRDELALVDEHRQRALGRDRDRARLRRTRRGPRSRG